MHIKLFKVEVSFICTWYIITWVSLVVVKKASSGNVSIFVFIVFTVVIKKKSLPFAHSMYFDLFAYLQSLSLSIISLALYASYSSLDHLERREKNKYKNLHNKAEKNWNSSQSIACMSVHTHELSINNSVRVNKSLR